MGGTFKNRSEVKKSMKQGKKDKKLAVQEQRKAKALASEIGTPNAIVIDPVVVHVPFVNGSVRSNVHTIHPETGEQITLTPDCKHVVKRETNVMTCSDVYEQPDIAKELAKTTYQKPHDAHEKPDIIEARQHELKPTYNDFSYPVFNPDLLIVGKVKLINRSGNDSYGFAITNQGDIYFNLSDQCYADIEFRQHEPDPSGCTVGLAETPFIQLTSSRFMKWRKQDEPLTSPEVDDHVIMQIGTGKTGRVKALYWTEHSYYEDTIRRAEALFVYAVYKQTTYFGGRKGEPTQVWIGFDYKANQARYKPFTKGDTRIAYFWKRILPVANEGEAGCDWEECDDPRPSV